MVADDRELRNRLQKRPVAAKGAKVVRCLVDEHMRLGASAIGSEQRDEARFARFCILAEPLACLRLAAIGVEQIVRDLEREAEALPVSAQTHAIGRARIGQGRARFDAPPDQRARLEALQPDHTIDVSHLAGKQVEHLASRHSRAARRHSEISD